MQTISEIKEEKIDPAVSTVKQKLGDARRRIKQIDLREKVGHVVRLPHHGRGRG